MPPAGFKRSRALWENTTNSSWRPLWRAILYELQPIRRQSLEQTYSNYVRGGGGGASSSYWTTTTTTITRWTTTVVTAAKHCLTVQLPAALRSVCAWRWEQWRYVIAAIVYGTTVRWMHQALQAGPFVVIATALVAIFTVGLSDDENKDGGLSAYSVFNKGFQKLLGSVDADALLQQYVGGAGAGAAGGMMMMAAANGGAGGMPNNNNNNNEPAAARRRNDPVVVVNDNEDDDDDDDDDETNNLLENENNNHHHRGGAARRSNKKSRRTEQRREIQRQRQAAAALGLDGVGVHEHDLLLGLDGLE